MNPITLYARTDGSSVFAMTLAEICLGAGRPFLWGSTGRARGPGGVAGLPFLLDGPNECKDLATTGALGLFVFPRLANGDYTLTPSRAGYAFSPPTEDVTLAGNHSRIMFIATCP